MKISLIAVVSLISVLFLSGLLKSSAQDSPKTIDRWIDYPFDSSQPVGSAKNPAVILPATTAALLGDLPAARRAEEFVIVPVSELKKVSDEPLTRMVIDPVIKQLPGVKSFDGFSAVDGTSLLHSLPSQLYQVDAAARRASGEDFEKFAKLLRRGDIVFGSHMVNWMTWGRYNHVAIVSDPVERRLLEATAAGPETDKPGVRETDWKTLTKDYGHVGVVRVRNATADDITRVIRWIEERKGRPYRWPFFAGLDKNDESRFYCSQLIWRAFKQTMNIDLDSDKGALVFPDDIYNAKDYVDIVVP